MSNHHFSTVLGILALLAALAAPAKAAEAVADPSTQREFNAKLGVCNACHGLDGVPKTTAIPVIWGQQESYIVKQLHDFRTKDRDVEIMKWMSESLSEAELAPVAAYFAKQKWPAKSAGAAPPQAPRGIAVCQACHQADFRGAVQAEGTVAPQLAGQTYEYLVEAMRRFAEGERKNNATMAQLMAGI